MKDIVVVDYGMGNLKSVLKAVEAVGGNVRISGRAEDILRADALILPGVGAFRDAVHNLKKDGLWEATQDFIKKGKPFLGICLGLQLLMEESEEFGHHTGFGYFYGKVVRFPERVGKIPHMGWNSVYFQHEHPVLKDLPDGTFFYFVHSYYCASANKEDVLAFTEYTINFPSAMARDNVVAFQFHPEKSQKAGLKILENFITWGPC